ncbi:MFS transporter [Gudongella oleilytica]|uniref:MFS transporter n=1 Tax=Gudongella oleilytica TaxID=1582259 RepID=UPI002A36A7D7|nr:MFS transporter [Gudongella oleilytica]
MERRILMDRQYKKLMIISVFLWLTTNFHHPVNPTYFTELNLPNHVFGTSMAFMVSAVFLTSPIWGSLGDNYGRKKTLVYSTLLYGMTQIAYGMSTQLWHILLLRAIAGMFSGGFMVGFLAAVVDVSDESNRAERIAAFSAVMSVSMSIGFLIGGILGYLPVRYVFYIQGIVMMAVSLAIHLTLGETNSPSGESTKPDFIWNILKDKDKSKAVFTPWILIFLGVTLFVFIAYSSNTNAFNYYLKEQLDFKPIVNGIWRAGTGIFGLIANLTINVWLARNYKGKNALVIFLSFTLLGSIMIYANTSIIPFMGWSLFYFTMHTVLFPMLQSFAVKSTEHGAGFMSGLFSASRSLGEMLGALIAGFAYGIGNRVPFLLSIIAIAIALILGVMQLTVRTGKESN